MGPVKSGFELVAKRDRLKQADQPTQVPMRPERAGQQRRNPSTDQKRVQRQMRRSKTAASDEQLSYARQKAQQAGSASVSGVSGTDMLAICSAAGNDSDETVKWVRSQAEQAGQHSVSRVSGTDLLKVCDMAEHGDLANNVPPGGWDDDGPSYGHEDNDGKHPGDSASDESPYYASLTAEKTPVQGPPRQLSLSDHIRSMQHGNAMEVGGHVIRYDERPAYGDDNRPVPGLTTGNYEICRGTLDDLMGQKHVHDVHVSPETGGGSKDWSARQVAQYVLDHRTTAAATEGSTMSRESDILAAMATAPFADRQRLASELNRLRAEKTASARRSMEVDFSSQVVAQAGPMGVTAGSSMSSKQVTAESDWLGDAVPDEVNPQEIVNEVTAEASIWFDNLHQAVKDDPAEFAAQAQGYAFRVAGKFGTQHPVAVDAFVRTAERMRHLADNPDVPPASAYDHTNDEGSSLPLAVDNDKTFDADVTATAPAQGYHPTAPSLAEGNAPAASVSQSSENPIGAGDTSYDHSNHSAPLTDYIDGTATSWKGAGLYPQHPGLVQLASSRHAADEWGFMQHTADDQDTSDVMSDSPSLSQGNAPAGDTSQSPIQELRSPGTDVKDGGNNTWVDDLNGMKTSPDGVTTGGLRPLAALASAIQQGEASRGRLVSPEARPFLMAMASLETADETYAGVSGRDMVQYLTASVGTLTSPQAQQALAELQMHLAADSARKVAAGPVPPQFQKNDSGSSSSPSSSSPDSSSSDDSKSDDDPACKRSGCGHPKSKHSGGTGQCSECSCSAFQATADDDSKDKDSDSSSSSAPSGSGDSKPPWLTNKATSAFRQRVQANLAASN